MHEFVGPFIAVVEENGDDNGANDLNINNNIHILHLKRQLPLRLQTLILHKEPRRHIRANGILSTRQPLHFGNRAFALASAVFLKQLADEVIAQVVAAVAVGVAPALLVVLEAGQDAPVDKFANGSTVAAE